VFETVPHEAVSALEPGKSAIGDALARLGAPLYVWEGAADGIVLAYGSENRTESGVTVSVPVFDQFNASFAYDDVAANLDGYVLIFDAELKLQLVRSGSLRELSKVVRVRPSPVE
jgi:hypothetical protein